jgi:hypothetical protein
MQKLIICAIVTLILLIGCTQPTDTENNSAEYDPDYVEMNFPPDSTGEDVPLLPTGELDNTPPLTTDEGEESLPPELPPMDE